MKCDTERIRSQLIPNRRFFYSILQSLHTPYFQRKNLNFLFTFLYVGSVALRNCSCFSQNLWAFRSNNYAMTVTMSSSSWLTTQNQSNYWEFRNVQHATFRLFFFFFRRMQTMWSPDQTVWSSKLTQSRNSLFFSSSKVILIFCVCFLPDEATEGPPRWSGVTGAPSLFYTNREETSLKNAFLFNRIYSY